MKCLKCDKNIPDEIISEGEIQCPDCNSKISCTIFPANFQHVEKGINPEKVNSENDASCYYHSDKSAVSACAKCGVYICALCNIEITEENLCPKCFNKSKNDYNLLQMSTVMHDEIAFNTVALSILMWPLMFITAPCVIVYSIWGFKHFNYPYKKLRIKLYVSLIIALLQIIAMVFLTLALMEKI